MDLESLRFAESHEWAKQDGDIVTVGITQYAVDQLTDVTHLQLPKVGAKLTAGKPFGEIWKVGWAGVKDKWPSAYKAIKAFTLDNGEMGKMITEVDLNGKKVEEVVAAWMSANEPRWGAWIKN